jgi:integrase/recombinase XerD
LKDRLLSDQPNTNTQDDFALPNKNAKSEETQRIIRFLTNEIRKHNITQPTLRYIYRSVMNRANLVVPKKAKKLYRLPTTSELDAFLGAIQNPQEHLIFQLMLTTGARCSEIVSIQCKNINFDDNTILIRGKGNKERLLIMTPRMTERLKYFLVGFERSRKFLFLNRRHLPYSVRRIEQLCQHYKEVAGIDANWTPHGLRHYTLSHLSGTSNLSLSVVQRVAGHSNIQTTQIYQNLGIDGSKSLVLEKLQELEAKHILK